MGLAQPQAGVVVEDVGLYLAVPESLHNKVNSGDFNNKQLSSQLIFVAFDGQSALPLPLGVVSGRHVGGVTLRLGCILLVLADQGLALDVSELTRVLANTGVMFIPCFHGTLRPLVVAPLDNSVEFRFPILLQEQLESGLGGDALILHEPALANVPLGSDDCREVPLDGLLVKDGPTVLELHSAVEEVVDALQQELRYHLTITILIGPTNILYTLIVNLFTTLSIRAGQAFAMPRFRGPEIEYCPQPGSSQGTRTRPEYFTDSSEPRGSSQFSTCGDSYHRGLQKPPCVSLLMED